VFVVKLTVLFVSHCRPVRRAYLRLKQRLRQKLGQSVSLGALIFILPAAATAMPQMPPTPTNADQAAQAADMAADPGLSIEDVTRTDDEIVVTANYQRGTVPGDIKPEIQLGEDDIRAFGASNLADLLQELGPQLRSGRGRGGEPPVVLVGGRRVSGFAEIRNLPPEALERVDILPEEVALKYGYKADQRVINFVLKDLFTATTVELEPGFATDGGRGSFEGKGNFLRLADGGRLSLEGEYTRNGLLLESERRITTPAPAQPFSLGGNLAGGPLAGGGFAEIDSALSAFAGAPVSIVSVPASAATSAPSLARLAASAAASLGAPASTADLTPFRSLLPQTTNLSLGATLNREIGTVSATLSGRFEATDSESRLGLAGVTLGLPPQSPFSPLASPVTLYRYAQSSGPLLRNQENRSGRAALALNWDKGSWRWSLNASYDRSESNTLVDRSLDSTALQARLDSNDPAFNPFAAGAIAGDFRQDRARSINDLGSFELVSSGSPLSLPAGPVVSTIKAGFDMLRQNAFSDRGGFIQNVALGRDQGRVQASFDVPLTSVRNDVLSAAGDISLNFNASLDQLSDFGTLTSIGYGLNWAPSSRLRLLVSVSHEEAAPTIQQLGNPLVVTPNVRIFDLVNGETVDITRLDGGNAALTADSRRVIKIGGSWKPFASELNLSMNFIDSRLKGQVETFPTATPEIEAAFPDRFVRDAGGRLLQIDNRPINFAGADRQELRTGLSLFQSLKPTAKEKAEAERRRDAFEKRKAERDAANGETPATNAVPPPRGGRGGGSSGRIFVSLFYTLHTINRINIRDGIAPLDLLNGSATSGRGGQPRHEVEMRIGANKAGLGGRLSLDWRSGSTIKADPSIAAPGNGDLIFSDFATLNLRLFADLGSQRRLLKAAPFLRGSRVSLKIDNITNARLNVRNRLGDVPLGYQPDQLDPLGRTIGIQFRKVFLARPPEGERRGK